ncbi:MAG: hypothetical protein IIB74_09300 [Proteobacteria bacterium]|nr:hypothetical protein [Pseudomonadota bacterium]
MKIKKHMRRERDRFIKYHGPTVVDDWIRVRALSELVEALPRIRTATPLSVDDEKLEITYEWLGDLPRMITLPHAELLRSIADIGLGLAQIHEQGKNCDALEDTPVNSVLPLETVGIDEPTSRLINDCLPIGFFHGDCWHANVLIDDAGDCVLIDPIPSLRLFGERRYMLANGIVDLATMHMSLTMMFPLANLLRLNLDRQLEIGEVLLASYLRHFDALSMRKFVLQLSRSLAIRYATSYPKYINYLVGWVKMGLSKKIIAATDKRLSW